MAEARRRADYFEPLYEKLYSNLVVRKLNRGLKGLIPAVV